ncbi:glutathione S-transferase family protein [Methylobacterium sp. Leaf106]|uniref:glutathione S-transferase family protein n=1 Tax=Methylobacterium sp. Leaf106 TaxID=1736255 RepID=UPI000701B5C6|nr:glutathione S-transferase family protein [Methylobacterium sp. Leaf106]KQP40584.1 glutathione S-transferase [Methylobacterium sp. Leaf106]
MKLFHSHFSPFARKVMACAHVLGLVDRIELLPSAAHPVKRDGTILAHHPMAQVPTLLDDEGHALADSRVICEYLDARAGGGLFPPAGPARWTALNEQSIADGILDAALLIRYELTARDASERSVAWMDGQEAKIRSALATLDDRAGGFADRVDIGTISIACALGYLDLRFTELGWKQKYPDLAAWFTSFAAHPAMEATKPPAA